jgi:hypothetical protein
MPGGFQQFAHHDAWWAGPLHLLPILLLAALIGVVIWGVLRMTAAPAAVASAPGSIPRRDPAEEALRVGYARGEIDRDALLARSADLAMAARSDQEE